MISDVKTSKNGRISIIVNYIMVKWISGDMATFMKILNRTVILSLLNEKKLKLIKYTAKKALNICTLPRPLIPHNCYFVCLLGV